MPLYWEYSAGGVQAKNFDMKEDDEDCEIQKLHMKNVEGEKQIKDLTVNTMLIFDL